jgi:hypothetical protein
MASSSGQPIVARGQIQDDAQVSSTSSSCSQFSGSAGASAATRTLEVSLRSASVSASRSSPFLYQTGIRCPHHSWRLMHQSWMFSNQCR